jgi:hypothetical protein
MQQGNLLAEDKGRKDHAGGRGDCTKKQRRGSSDNIIRPEDNDFTFCDVSASKRTQEETMKKKDTILSVLQDIRRNTQPVVVNKLVETDRFIRNQDGTVTDNLLGLTWGQTLSKKFNWEYAKKECEKIGYRLPTRRELESLVDITKSNPALDKEIFPDTKTDDYYWTSDSVADYPASAWMVGFNSGYVRYFHKGSNFYVRPVRPSK